MHSTHERGRPASVKPSVTALACVAYRTVPLSASSFGRPNDACLAFLLQFASLCVAAIRCYFGRHEFFALWCGMPGQDNSLGCAALSATLTPCWCCILPSRDALFVAHRRLGLTRTAGFRLLTPDGGPTYPERTRELVRWIRNADDYRPHHRRHTGARRFCSVDRIFCPERHTARTVTKFIADLA